MTQFIYFFFFFFLYSFFLVFLSFFFFFQAEDGIRDLVRSRGLGDVYKRQGFTASVVKIDCLYTDDDKKFKKIGVPTLTGLSMDMCPDPVSYTHLTLPTSDLV